MTTLLLALRVNRMRWTMAWLAAIAIAHLSAAICQQAAAADPRAASTSQKARDEAVRAIPFDQLADDDRKDVEAVIRSTSIYRRLPTQVIDCDPNLYQFFLDHPELIVNIWDQMGISNVSLRPVDKGSFIASDGEGTSGTLRIVHNSHDKHVLYASGVYEGGVITRPMQAQCVILLQSRYLRETNGRHYVTARLDTFIHLDRVGVELLVKTIQPFIGKAADTNFTETMAFVSTLSRTAEINPAGTQRIADRLTKVEPEVRTQFTLLSRQLAERSAAQQADVRRVQVEVRSLK